MGKTEELEAALLPESEVKVHMYPQDDISIPSLVELERDFLQETIVHGFANWSEGGLYANISLDAELFESIKAAHLAKHTRA